MHCYANYSTKLATTDGFCCQSCGHLKRIHRQHTKSQPWSEQVLFQLTYAKNSEHVSS